MSIVIGLTGPTGSGKSSTHTVCKELGITVVDCDIIARKATVKGSNGLKALSKKFGKEIILPNGELDRKALARIAFSSPKNTKILNETIFPFIKELVLAEIKGSVVLLDAPTLFESGINSICNKTVAVLADRDIRMDRILKRDCILESDAQIRLNAAKTDAFFIEKADYVIYNNTDSITFLNEFKNIVNDIIEKEKNYG